MQADTGRGDAAPGGAGAVAEVIDAHHHLWPASAVTGQAWQPAGESVLRRAFEPADLRPDLAAAGVAGTVLMQGADGPEENERLRGYAAEGFVRGVVAWAPLDRPREAPAVLDGLLDRWDPQAAPVVGARCLVGTDPMAQVLGDDGMTALRHLARAGLAWDVVPVTAEQRDVVARAAAAVPDLRVVVDHLAAPPLDDAGMLAWRAGLDRLAAAPNVAVKLSVGVAVLTRWRRWEPARLASWVSAALEAFGAERSMLASNWPVVLLRAGYARAWADARAAAVASLAPAEAAAVLGGTASRWYGLADGAGRAHG